jgi:hypothetical protein
MTPHAGDILCTQIVPRIRAAVPSAVRPIGAEDAAELIQDGTAMAARMVHNAERAESARLKMG